jgi:AsmA protein
MIAGAKLAVDGTVKRPRDASGYDLAISLNFPALDTLGRALPPALTSGLALPPLQNIAATAHIADRKAPLPSVTNLTMTAGKSDLSALRPGLILNELTISIPALDQSASIAASGTSNGSNFTLQGEFGALQSLLPPPWQPTTSAPVSFPVSLFAQVGDAKASITGAIATPQTLSGAALAMTATIPVLSALSGFAGFQLPAWKNISLQTSVTDPGGAGLYNIVGLDDLTATMDNAAFGGAATLYLSPQQKLQLSLSFSHADLDALIAAYPTQVPATPAAQATIPPAPPAAGVAVIPDVPLPLSFLSWGNADIQLAADNVIWNRENYTALQANLTLAGKKLTIAPVTGEIPGGGITANATLDGSVTPATEALTIKAPALALGPLLKTFNLPGTADGNLELQLVATSSGNTPHAIAADLSGQLGLATVDSQLDAVLFNRALGPIEKAAGNPPFTGGPVSVRCFGLAIDASQGVAKVTSLGIDSSQLILQGSGSVNLGQETYNLSFQPLTGANVLLGGSFAQPALNAGPQPPIAAQPVVQVPQSAPPPRPDICPATLEAARLGQSGPAAPPPINSTPAPTPTEANAPKNLLNALLPP